MPARFTRPSWPPRSRSRRLLASDGGLGSNSGRDHQDRRSQRLLRTVRRSGRQRVVRRRSTRGGGLRQGGGRPQGRDHLRRSSEQARHRRCDCTAMGGPGRRRRDRRPRQFRRRSRGQLSDAREESRDARFRNRDFRPHREILSTDDGPMGSRYLALGNAVGRTITKWAVRPGFSSASTMRSARLCNATRPRLSSRRPDRCSARCRIRSAQPISARIFCRRKPRAQSDRSR